MKTRTIAIVVAYFAVSTSALADEKDNRPAAGVQDNSFLIEEAYNQEAGVVQHINGWRRQGKDWSYAFTQEWPVISQSHQFSYSVPYLWLYNDGARNKGVGDVFLNYRFQALKESDSLPAFAPRASLILPAGDRDKGTGNESIGYQFNLPFSKIVSDRVTMHFNAGHTAFRNVEGLSPKSYNLGASTVYAVSRETNLMIEVVKEWNESVSAGMIEKERPLTLSPGIRHAFNFKDDSQLVVGAALPVTITPEKRDYGVFFYLSYEHNFKR